MVNLSLAGVVVAKWIIGNRPPVSKRVFSPRLPYIVRNPRRLNFRWPTLRRTECDAVS